MAAPSTRFAKVVLFANGLVPAAFIGWDAWHGRLGANPIEFITRSTGTLTLVFLVATLAVTPLRKLAGLGWLVKLRRMLGLYAFFYGTLHLITYLWLDQFFDLGAILADAVSRWFIAVGLCAYGFMVPLAVTSTNGWIKRMGGKRWQKLHRRVYLVAILGVAHYWMLVKADVTRPLVFAGLVAALLGWRLVVFLRRSPGGDRENAGGVGRDGVSDPVER